ncbi:hypothetical protein CS0771_66210 [Catellatospora sp. IY07-71]|uniref:hypothetical protein n=1 Tax=Catellatospora sp. IY07-71 TaxID=2728827 RepID=UPI001BB32E19|nr:hypothetical protein [Catellatospora sp. IY07-71]BCJ77077.1 hypothetical protein CS0771_66210 [Catellatospora sp. IY07-71]
MIDAEDGAPRDLSSRAEEMNLVSAAGMVVGAAAVLLYLLVPDARELFGPAGLVGLALALGLGPQAARYGIGRRRGVPRRRLSELPGYLLRISPFRLLHRWLAATLAIGALLWLLVPADWVEAWFCVALVCVLVLYSELGVRRRGVGDKA